MERYHKFEKRNFTCFLQIIREIKFCLQLNTDDLTWRIFFSRQLEKMRKLDFF